MLLVRMNEMSLRNGLVHICTVALRAIKEHWVQPILVKSFLKRFD